MAGRGPRCGRCDAGDAEIAALRKRVFDLEALVRELRARLNRDSTNSSMPPSSDMAGTERPRKPPTGRKPGGQPGHEGTTRTPFSRAEVDRRVEVFPEECGGCGRRLRPEDAAGTPFRRQTVDLPPVAAVVTEYLLFRCRCPRCGRATRAVPPPDAAEGLVGPRLQAAMALLSGRFRMSRREVVEALPAVFGEKARVSLGTVAALEKRTSAAIEGPWREVREAVRGSPRAGADETSWRKGGRLAWLWVARTRRLALFLVDERRGRGAFGRLLGNYAGVLTTDRWSAYSKVRPRRRQLCWAHLARNFKAVEERGGSAGRIGTDGRAAAAQVALLWRAFDAGRISRAGMLRRLRPLKARLRWRLRLGLRDADRKARGMCRDLLRWWTSLWTFARVPGVEPTNNAAERALRKAVLWRKGSFGSASEAGCRFAEGMLTAAESLRAQGRGVLEFLEAAIRAHRVGSPHPSLLPPASA